MNVDKNVVIKEEPSVEENTLNTKSETMQINVKIERESESEDDVESGVDSYADHEIKREKIVIEIEPVVLQDAYNYNTNISEDEHLRNPKLETTDDETDQVEPQKEIKGNCPNKVCKSEKPYACSLCVCKFIRKSDLKRHSMTHTGEKPYACSLCSYKCTQKNNLTRHFARTHTNEKPFSCSLCQYRCALKCDLMKHLKTHGVEKPYACPIYVSENPTLEIKYDETEINPRKETKGNDSEENTSYFAFDPQSQSGEKVFPCSFCECIFLRKGHWKRHLRIHTGEKPFSCSFCEYRCTQKNNLLRHMRTHSDDKPYCCSLCQYKCSLKHNLVRHMRTHTNEKPYSCSKCQYRCTQKCHLNKHMKSHNVAKPFSCSLCEYKCARKSLLTRHGKRIHSGSNKATEG